MMLISPVLPCCFVNIKLSKHLYMIHIYVSAYIYLNYVSNREKNYVHPKFQNLMDFDWLMKLPVWVNCISERGYRTRTPKSKISNTYVISYIMLHTMIYTSYCHCLHLQIIGTTVHMFDPATFRLSR
jgi:hypothetical protein